MKLITNVYRFGLVMHMKRKKKKKKNGGNFMKLITYVYHLGLVMHMKWKKWREFLETYYKCVSLWSGDAHEMELEMYL